MHQVIRFFSVMDSSRSVSSRSRTDYSKSVTSTWDSSHHRDYSRNEKNNKGSAQYASDYVRRCYANDDGRLYISSTELSTIIDNFILWCNGGKPKNKL